MKILSACLVLLLYLISADTTSAQDRGEQLFNQTCVACHSIGRGRLVGPDLAGVHSRRSEEWIIQFVQSSTKLIASGDPDAEALFKEYSGIVMPDHAVSADDVRAILGYIARKSPSEVITEETVVSASEPTESNAVLGRDLFVGRVRFENGAAACNTCHTVNTSSVTTGGSLAKNLTDAVVRLSAPGVNAMMASPPFPAMRSAFVNNPLTESERAAVADFLTSVSQEENAALAPDDRSTLLLGGFIGILALLGIFFLIGLRGAKKSINQALYDRQIQSI